MAIAMSHVNEVLRMFPTTVIVEQKDWAELMDLFKFDKSKPIPVLDRMTLVPIPGGYKELNSQMGKLLAENDQLKAKISELEAKMAVADAKKVIAK